MAIKLTVDIVVLDESGWDVLLIKRAKEPFMDKYVLPGGHVEETDLSLAHAAVRELEEEVGIKAETKDMFLLTTLDAIDRDPRTGRRISIVFEYKATKEQIENAKAASDALSHHMVRLASLTEGQVGFDHWKAIELLDVAF